MSDLLSLLRANDMPPKWNGLAALWQDWRYDDTRTFICPPPAPSKCEGCGEPDLHKGFSTRLVTKALVAVSSVLTHEDLLYEEANRGRLGVLAHKRKARALWRLHAWRCQVCQLDTVWDMDPDEWFTLDDSDYGDEGSA